MTPETMRAVDLTAAFIRFREMPHQMDVHVERLGTAGEAMEIAEVARHVGLHPVTVDPASVLLHLGADGMLVDGFYGGGRPDEVAWYSAWMTAELPVLILDVTDDPATAEARRRLDLWTDPESAIMILLIMDEATGGDCTIARPRDRDT